MNANQIANLKCLELLINLVKENPDLSIRKLILSLDGVLDTTEESPNDTLLRWMESTKKLKTVANENI